MVISFQVDVVLSDVGNSKNSKVFFVEKKQRHLFYCLHTLTTYIIWIKGNCVIRNEGNKQVK